METDAKYLKILDFIYQSDSLPPDLNKQLQLWMLKHEDSFELDKAMHRIWDEELANAHANIDVQALNRLLEDVSYKRNEGGQYAPKPPAKFRHKWKKYAAAILLVIASSAATLLVNEKLDTGKDVVLITAAGSIGEFTLPDGSLVKLNSGSKLSYNEKDFATCREVKVDGEAYFDVKKDLCHPFRVGMTNLKVEVLGTQFDVRNYPFCSNEEVVLLTGKVQAVNESGNKYMLHPNQMLLSDAKTGKISVNEVKADNYCRWSAQILKIENEPLGDLLTTISRTHCLDLVIEEGVDIESGVSITLHNDSLEEIMDILSYITDISWRLDDHTLTIYPKNLNNSR